MPTPALGGAEREDSVFVHLMVLDLPTSCSGGGGGGGGSQQELLSDVSIMQARGQ